MTRSIPLALALISALAPMPGAAQGALDFVTDPVMCAQEPLARDEIGMTFDGSVFSTIEYYCEITEALEMPSWNGDRTEVRIGYCEEPGALFPTVFVLRWGSYEPGKIFVYEGESGEPTTYHLCSG